MHVIVVGISLWLLLDIVILLLWRWHHKCAWVTLIMETRVSQIPQYPFRVSVTIRTNSNGAERIESHNYANMAAAIAYRDTALNKPRTKRVEVMMVLDQSTPAHPG